MELNEFHVHDGHPGPIGHRNTIPRGDGWIGCVQVALSASACCQNHHFSRNRQHLLRSTLQNINPHHAVGARKLHFFGSHQIDRHHVFPNLNTGRGPHRREKRFFEFLPGDIARMKNPALGVSRLFPQIRLIPSTVLTLGKPDAQFNQLRHAGRAVLYHLANHILPAQTRSRRQSVPDMQLG